MQKKLFTILSILGISYQLLSADITINHTCTDLSLIPDEWINAAKANLHIVYQHTSHGSQLITGMNALKNFPVFVDKYDWSDNGSSGLDLDDYGIPGVADLSLGDYIDENGVTPWVTSTRNLLDNEDNYHINVVVWSWCSINGHNIPRYLANMEILISEYSEGGSSVRAAAHPVQFVFMTGHAEGQGETGFIFNANQQIRQHCLDYDRILFDFADIESYDPDIIYYYDKPMWDDLDYNPDRTNNWALEWCTDNPGSELEQLTTGINVDGYDGCQDCAHSSYPQEANLNCVLKGRSSWWMWARLSGWGGDDPLPVSLNTLTAIAGNEQITIKWSTASEIENQGFIVFRSTQENGEFIQIASFKDDPSLMGMGNTSGKSDYSYFDYHLINGQTYWYKIVDVDYNDYRVYYGPISATPFHSELDCTNLNVPTTWALSQNYPNPFNPSTKINFDVPSLSENKIVIQINVFDMYGKKVKALFAGALKPGSYQVEWDGTNITGNIVSSGLYFYKLNSKVHSISKKMILVR